jgi:hypothetical protein
MHGFSLGKALLAVAVARMQARRAGIREVFQIRPRIPLRYIRAT